MKGGNYISEVALIVSGSFIVMFIVFGCVALIARKKIPSSREDLDIITGELVGFRKEYLHINVSNPSPRDSHKFNEDFINNAYGRVPIFKVEIEGVTITKTTPIYSSTLTRFDVGKTFTLLFNGLDIIIDDDTSFNEYKKIGGRMFIVFAIIAEFFFLLSIISCVYFNVLFS